MHSSRLVTVSKKRSAWIPIFGGEFILNTRSSNLEIHSFAISALAWLRVTFFDASDIATIVTVSYTSYNTRMCDAFVAV